LLLVLASALLATSPVAAADPWHRPGWQARAIVEIPKPLAEAGVDTAGVKVLCQGKAKADGSDYRVVDAAGNAVPFQLMFHDAGRYSLISFRAADPKQRYFLYFDNPKADRAAEQVTDTGAPGSGPPKGAWTPRHGLVLQTIQRPEGPNPKTIEDMARLIAASKTKYGARYQRRISDGYNAFGPSDYYISIYKGWLQIRQAGTYKFCTVSNEASFSFLDGKPLVHWPGRHTVDRGIHGEINTTVTLTAGPHYVEYYHEEVTLEQMAFLGWLTPEQPAKFDAIPESVYTAPHPAVVTRYEDARGPQLTFEPVITDSIWPSERHEGQYTRARFQVSQAPPLPGGSTCRWDFGDGQTATGPDVYHVYLALGTYAVTLAAQTPQGTLTARWPLEIYEIENVTDQFKEGSPKDYAKTAKLYDRGKLDAAGLRELAYLLAESEEPAEALAVGKEFVQRFGVAEAKRVPGIRRLLADCSLRLGKGGIDEAIANYRASLTKDTPLPEKLDTLSHLMRLLGIERNQPEKAGEVLGQVEETVRGAALDDDARSAYRRAVIAAGDVLLWHGKRDGARNLYLRAEDPKDLALHLIPAQVRAARTGAYPDSIRDFIKTGNYGAALDIVNRWEETFPNDKLKGQTFFWRGKLLGLRDQHENAARYLARAVGLAVGAAFESEARWLLATSLQKLNRPEEARRELAKLIASGIQDDFTRMAKEKLKESLK
jgi:hypothetical protein